MSEWKETTLGELVTFQRGHDLPKTEFNDGEYPILGSNGIIGYHNEYTTEGAGITIGRSGNIGNPFYTESKFWAHNTTLYVKEFHNSFPKFVFYFLKTIDFQSFNSGSAVPSLNRNYIHPFPIFVPENIEEQKRIADVLSCLDAKIDKLRRQNETLEQIARSLFKHWFIDFEFPNADGKPYKSSGGAMFDSELGDIPKGWNFGELGEFTDISIGRTPPRKDIEWFSTNPKDIKWVSIRDMGNCGIYIVNTSEYLTQDAIDKFNIPVIPEDTVILSFKLTVGRVTITTEKMLSNEAIAHIKLIDNYLNTEYLYLFLKQYNFSSLGSTSSIATAVNSKSIKSISVLRLFWGCGDNCIMRYNHTK